ncbi:MAG TPA: hypothetical protein VMU04_25920, partial [Candidatus Acidoferrum sp.]|nr:hypothetical protein [Candidatus Acidoferrum sp.]
MSQPLIGASTPARRLALALVICGALGSFGALWWTCSRNPEVYFLPRLAPAQWITWAAVPRATLNARVELATVFRRSFTLDQAPRAATLSVAGLRRYALAVNGRPAPTPEQSARTWKQPDRFDVHGELQAGTNEVAVTVWNSNGPPALWASLDLGGRRLDSDETWQVSCAGAAWRQARLAGKPKPALAGSAAYGGEEPWASLRTRWATLGLFAALSAAAYWLFNRLAGPALVGSASASSVAARLLRSDFLPVFVLGLVWVALFVNNLGMLPNLVGYDVDSHQAYVQFIQQHHALPRADQGWEMFQPPLYYALSAGLLDVLSLSARQDGGVMALRVLGMVIGIAHLMLVWACLRLVFPGERAAQRSGLVLAAAMPPLLYVSQYVSNEGLAAALVSACVFLTLRMIKQERLSWTSCAGLGLCLGAALLAKATALVAVPAVLAALLWKAWVGTAKAAGPGARLVLQLGAIVLICAAVCGWHYGRLWAQYGSPLIGVWDPRLGFSWWQDNGYRTSGFYLRFGSVLAHPWFSSFSSFADGIYGTLWGDGLLGGGADAVARPPWNYDLMAVGYWLALVPTLALLVGG